MNNKAAVLRAQGRFAEAESLHRETLDIQGRVLGKEHPETLASIHNLANSILAQGNYAEAAVFSAQAVDGGTKAFPSEHPFLARYRTLHGQILIKLDRLNDAEEHLLESYPILSVSGMRTEANEAAQALVDLYEARHAAEPDAGFDTKTASWRAKVEHENEATKP